jgi:hypothetical protein
MRTVRSLPGKLRYGTYLVHWPLGVGLLFAMFLTAAVHRNSFAEGQSQAPPIPQFPTTPGQNAGRTSLPGQETDPNPDPMIHRAQLEAAKKRNIYRQNKLVADSDKIVQLAQELGTAAQPEGKGSDSPAMSKKADEIEKLARNVRDLMKSE